MKKVAFFLNNKTMKNVDYSSIKEGNPGIAGSEYEFLLVPYLLEQRNIIQAYLLVNFEGKFPHQNIERVNNLNDCCLWCIKNDVPILVIDIKYVDIKILQKYKTLSFVIWAHNNATYSQLSLFTKLPYIKKIVNCGREELELYRDHIATRKSTYVYNIFPFKNKYFYESKIKRDNNHNVVYMGSLTKEKGFHVLAKAWKKVITKVPDAHLYVIGSGTLYNSEAKLGKYGIAEEHYENMFMHFLVDDNNKLLPSVHFLGLLKEEKYDIMGKCKVAVPNPTGISECLPITAIEMQLMGCNITTIQHAAYYDTVYNKEYLYKNETQLASYIVKRLNAPSDNYDKLFDFVTNNFGLVNIERWENIFMNIDNVLIENISQYNYQFKKLKDRLLKIKSKYPILSWLPCIEQFFLFKDKFKHVLSRIEFKDI